MLSWTGISILTEKQRWKIAQNVQLYQLCFTEAQVMPTLFIWKRIEESVLIPVVYSIMWTRVSDEALPLTVFLNFVAEQIIAVVSLEQHFTHRVNG
jgi:hypothetical protein